MAFPVVFQIGPFLIPAYTLCMLSAVLARSLAANAAPSRCRWGLSVRWRAGKA